MFIDITLFPDAGLYLVFPDGTKLVLTRSAIETCTKAILDDPCKIPKHIRQATDYQACDICPKRDEATICHAIMVTLPFFDDIDRYVSYDAVTAVFRSEDLNLLSICKTTIQSALQFVTILSLLYYCEIGRKYYPYFEGVNPLMEPPGIAKAVFKNAYLAHHGNLKLLNEIFQKMSDEILLTASCQVKRLALISKRDAFQNAFVNTEIIAHFILFELQKLQDEAAGGIKHT